MIMNKDKYLKIEKTSAILIASVAVFLSVNSCGINSSKNVEEHVQESIVDTTSMNHEEAKDVKKELVKKRVDDEVKKEDKAVEMPKVEEVPMEIGASPDAVYFLDDSETETTPKFPDGEKGLKKLLKSKLRKAGRGEKASFRVSMVVKSDGTIGRVQFTECGYADDYKEEIITTLKALPLFSPGTKDGVAVDSWYYLNYKR